MESALNEDHLNILICFAFFYVVLQKSLYVPRTVAGLIREEFIFIKRK